VIPSYRGERWPEALGCIDRSDVCQLSSGRDNRRPGPAHLRLHCRAEPLRSLAARPESPRPGGCFPMKLPLRGAKSWQLHVHQHSCASARVSFPCAAPVPRAGSIHRRVLLAPHQDVPEGSPALPCIHRKLNDLGGFSPLAPLCYTTAVYRLKSVSLGDNVVQLSARIWPERPGP
jgi:hypothetical protein